MLSRKKLNRVFSPKKKKEEVRASDRDLARPLVVLS